MTQPRREIFISYSHRDKEWLERLQIHLKPHFREGEVSVWADTQLEPGSTWYNEIDQALSRAVAAVLLLSPDFLASEFIMGTEWPRLSKAARERGLRILPVVVRSCAVLETDIAQFQGLMDLTTSLDQFGPAEQGRRLVDLARKIREHTQRVPDHAAESSREKSTAPLREFDLGMREIEHLAFDDDGGLWVSSAQQVRVFRLDQEQPVQRWLLPTRPWKGAAAEIVNGHLLLADWYGAIWRQSSKSRDVRLKEAGHDGVPFHLFARRDDGGICAAAWDGSIHRWNRDLIAVGQPIATPFLPTHLMPLADGSTCIADQSGSLRAFDAEGAQIWEWSAGGSITGAWSCRAGSERTIAAIIDRRRLIRIGIGDASAAEIALPTPVIDYSRRIGSEDEWIVLAGEGGRIDWVSLSPFNIIRDNSIETGFAIRSIIGVPPQGAEDQFLATAVGLTARGQLFVSREHRVEVLEGISDVSRLMQTPSGRFLFALAGKRLVAYRNPAIAAVGCSVTVEGYQGALVRGEFRKVAVRVRNAGRVAIHQLTARLQSETVSETSQATRLPTLPLAPGDTGEIEFSVRPQVAGDAVPMTLLLELGDEGGPPLSAVQAMLSLEVR